MKIDITDEPITIGEVMFLLHMLTTETVAALHPDLVGANETLTDIGSRLLSLGDQSVHPRAKALLSGLATHFVSGEGYADAS